MYTDNRLLFARAQALTVSAALVDQIDLGSDRDLGPGQPMWWVLQVDVAADAANGDETYGFNIQTDDNSGFSSATTIGGISVPRGTPAGARFYLGFANANERYLRCFAVLAGTTPSVTVTSFITSVEPANWQAYPAAISK